MCSRNIILTIEKKYIIINESDIGNRLIKRTNGRSNNPPIRETDDMFPR